MEGLGRQLEREFSPAAQPSASDTSPAASVSPISVATPTLPVRPDLREASSTPADVQAQKSQTLQCLFRGQLEEEAVQNGFGLLAAIRPELDALTDVSVLQRLLDHAATNWVIRAQSHSNKQRQLELELAQAQAALSMAQHQRDRVEVESQQIIARLSQQAQALSSQQLIEQPPLSAVTADSIETQSESSFKQPQQSAVDSGSLESPQQALSAPDFSALQIQHQALEANFVALNKRYSALQSTHAALQSAFDDSKAHSAALLSRYTDLQSVHATLESDFAVFKATHAGLQADISGPEASVSSTALLADVSVPQGSSTTLLADTSTRIGAVQSREDKIKALITKLTTPQSNAIAALPQHVQFGLSSSEQDEYKQNLQELSGYANDAESSDANFTFPLLLLPAIMKEEKRAALIARVRAAAEKLCHGAHELSTKQNA